MKSKYRVTFYKEVSCGMMDSKLEKVSFICNVRVVRVDGKDIKEGVRYKLIDGKIQKA